MARYPDDVLEAIRRAVRVEDVVGRAVPLRRAGRSWKGLCPFHEEKTPSFHVHPESGVWKCYGCQRGGNVFQFLVEREGLRFHEAVRLLAREGGVPLPDDDDPAAAERARRVERLREVTEWACRRFEAALREPGGERAREYYKRRGITGATAKAFRLGWAPPGWENLQAAARRDDVPVRDLLDAGLVIARDEERGGFYDRFRERVVFPIADAQGRVIAFGARTLGDDEPKYLNSPETPLYTKGRHLYALHLAKHDMMKQGEGAVMEGYTDVVLAHQAGFRTAVAGLGTALTNEQARLLVRYVRKLHLVYDGDAAGLSAAERAVPAFLPEEMDVRVCVLPGEKDPADVFAEEGEAAFRASLAQSRDAFDFLVDARREAHRNAGAAGLQKAIDECLRAIVPVADAARRARYVHRLADAATPLGLGEELLAERLAGFRGAAARSRAGGAAVREASAPPYGVRGGADGGAAGGRADDGHGDGEGDAAGGDAGEDYALLPAEAWLLEALLGCPALLAEVPPELPEWIGNRTGRVLARTLVRAHRESGRIPDVAVLVRGLAGRDVAALAASCLASGRGKQLEAQGRDCIASLRRASEARGLVHPESDDDLRRLAEYHRRRAGRSGAAPPGPGKTAPPRGGGV